ncbi:uncharacterized protein EI97DRAFT_374516 [Westerdykella ornata]|uniref:Uncharacterized protein n=1 Tax=Westerdykella ornata TaxID=318751 RepID=A0A6A6JP67_WESOR|nr:uncharacterized protein EI97DRAFT_374516 [Westerdykella ornata]KAF2277698.1 hypothetical protein EI97DRAFT_374516 [Westerdykella ornata]
MANWFGDLQLAYKYCVVFGALLLLTILAGCIKLLYDRRRLKKHSKEQENIEAGRKDDQMELNQREKDEGDLFGIRAIEAGFYAGIPQSRPTSRAGSFAESQNRSTSTLIGGASLALKEQTHSMSSSVTTLPLAHTAGNRDSSNSPPRRKSPPTIRLAPSEAELSGRINHSAAVNMNLNVPPSPVFGHGSQSPTFGGSDSGDSDGQTSPRSPNFRPDHYSPHAPQIPMPQGLTVSVHPAEDMPKSESASFNMDSAPSSRGPTPEARQPTLPNVSLADEPRSLYTTGQSSR